MIKSIVQLSAEGDSEAKSLNPRKITVPAPSSGTLSYPAPDDKRMLGPGGAPTRCTILPDDAAARKEYPIGSGFFDYFPDAIAEVARVSYLGNQQHNPGQPLHWARGKSTDEADTMLRHYSQRGTRDADGQRHSAKMVWRALAILQKEIEADRVEIRSYGSVVCSVISSPMPRSALVGKAQ